MTGSTWEGISVPCSEAIQARMRSVRKMAKEMLTSGTSGANGERYANATIKKITAPVAIVTSHRFCLIASVLSCWTGCAPVTSARKGPGWSPRTSLICSTPSSISKEYAARSKKSSTGSASCPTTSA